MIEAEFKNKYRHVIQLKTDAERFADENNINAAKEKYKEAAINAKLLLKRTDSTHYLFDLNVLLGEFYRQLELFNYAKEHAMEATNIDPSSETASLLFYLIMVEQNDIAGAINELKRFCDMNNNIIMYRDTIKELLYDAKKGRLPDFKNTIDALARKHISNG